MRWTRVPSHQDVETFCKKVGKDELWRREANDIADKVCGDFTATLDMTPQGLEEVKERDALHAKIIAHMSLEGKRSWVRLARHTQHPAYQLKAPVRLGGQKTHPNKVCRKKLEASSGGNREQTCAEWFDRLTRDDTQPPAWKWQGPNLACEACGLKLLHTKPRIQLEHRCKVRCAARETVRYEGVHVTHQLALRNPRFQCSICGGDPSMCVCCCQKLLAKKQAHTHTTASDSCKALQSDVASVSRLDCSQ